MEVPPTSKVGFGCPDVLTCQAHPNTDERSLEDGPVHAHGGEVNMSNFEDTGTTHNVEDITGVGSWSLFELMSPLY